MDVLTNGSVALVIPLAEGVSIVQCRGELVSLGVSPAAWTTEGADVPYVDGATVIEFPVEL